MSEVQASFLSNAASCLSDTESQSRLKSHLLWTCCTLRGSCHPTTSTMCPKCCQVWSLGKFSLRIKSMPPPGPRMFKILQKQETLSKKLNTMEASLLKRYQQKDHRKMVLLCHVCNNETVMPLKKRILETSRICQTPIVIECNSLRKRRKRKDCFAGLNASAVILASPSPFNKSSKNHSKLDTPQGAATPLALSSKKDLKFASSSEKTIKSATSTPLSSRLADAKNGPATPLTPHDSRQPVPLKKGGPKSIKKKMNLLREELKQAEQNRVKEEVKALTMRNLNVKKNNKLQDFLSKRGKDIHLQDRINSLLQL